MEFKCPDCGSDRLRQILSGAIIMQEVFLGERGIDEYGDPETEEGFMGFDFTYCCLKCAWGLPKVYDEEELVKWLKENQEN